MTNTRKAILYARTATAEVPTANHAMENQMNVMCTYCIENNIEVATTYDEVASGKTFKRPAFTQLLKYAGKHKGSINLLIVAQWDRFSRSFPEALLMEERLKDMGIKVMAVDQPVSSLYELISDQFKKEIRCT